MSLNKDMSKKPNIISFNLIIHLWRHIMRLQKSRLGAKQLKK